MIQFKRMLSELDLYLQKNNVYAMRSLKSIKQLPGPMARNILERVEDYIENFEYENARIVLGEFMTDLKDFEDLHQSPSDA